MCRFFFAHVARSNPLISKIWSSWIVSWALFLFSASFQLAKPCFLPCFPSSQKRFKRQNLQPKICSAPFAGSRADVKIQKMQNQNVARASRFIIPSKSAHSPQSCTIPLFSLFAGRFLVCPAPLHIRLMFHAASIEKWINR